MPVLLAVLGLLIGVFLGFQYPGYLPQQYLIYMAVAIIAALDSLLGALRSHFKKSFRLGIFATGFFFNMLLAALLTFLGQVLQIDLYLAVIVVFGTRIFRNLAEIRRFLLNYPAKKDKISI